MTVCEECGKEIVKSTTWQKHCSYACRRNAMYKKRKIDGNTSHPWRSRLTETSYHFCAMCEKDYLPSRAGQIFCSASCRNEYHYHVNLINKSKKEAWRKSEKGIQARKIENKKYREKLKLLKTLHPHSKTDQSAHT